MDFLKLNTSSMWCHSKAVQSPLCSWDCMSTTKPCSFLKAQFLRYFFPAASMPSIAREYFRRPLYFTCIPKSSSMRKPGKIQSVGVYRSCRSIADPSWSQRSIFDLLNLHWILSLPTICSLQSSFSNASCQQCWICRSSSQCHWCLLKDPEKHW